MHAGAVGTQGCCLHSCHCCRGRISHCFLQAHSLWRTGKRARQQQPCALDVVVLQLPAAAREAVQAWWLLQGCYRHASHAAAAIAVPTAHCMDSRPDAMLASACCGVGVGVGAAAHAATCACTRGGVAEWVAGWLRPHDTPAAAAGALLTSSCTCRRLGGGRRAAPEKQQQRGAPAGSSS